MNKRFAKFALGDIFDIYSPKKRFNANAVTFGGQYPYVARGSSSNGIKGYINEDVKYLSPGRTISFGQDTSTVFYQPVPYFTGDKIKVMRLKRDELDEKLAMYFLPVVMKAFCAFRWGQSSFNEKILNSIKISLPVVPSSEPNHAYTVADIDYIAMRKRIAELERERIAELERERIAELEAYLKASHLEDCELTEEDRKVLSRAKNFIDDSTNMIESNGRNEKIKIKRFLIQDVFHKKELKRIKKTFDKKNDLSKEPTLEFCLPLVNAKNGDNGIMYYGRLEDWEADTYCIDVVNDGAVSTGNVYAQPQRTGVLYNAYLIKPNMLIESEPILLYFAKCIEKSIKTSFGYDKKATWDRVKCCEISLPVTPDGDIDFDYMERYICAIEKVTIANVVKYRNRVIAMTKQVAGV